MTDYATTALVFVRTETGVVKVGHEERVPSDALGTEITRLAAVGLIVETEPSTESTAARDAALTPGVDEKKPAPKARNSRSQSGTSNKGA